jgi:hypothetical protein
MPKQRQQPRTTIATAEQAAAKRARLAGVLRANLARRKTQTRERAAGDANREDESPQGDDALSAR